MSEINAYDARAAALVFTSILDNLLESAINKNFLKIGKNKHDAIFRVTGAPLQAFSAKIAIGHAIGIYNNEYKSHLDRIRRIRNVFAHAMVYVDVDLPPIALQCNKLDPQKLITNAPLKLETNTAREQFIVSSNICANHILFYLNSNVSKNKPSSFVGKYG